LRQKKEKHILTRGQEHFNATCMPTSKLLMMHWHHSEEVKWLFYGKREGWHYYSIENLLLPIGSAWKPHITHTSPHINRTSPVYGHNCTSQHLYKPTNSCTVCVLNSSV